MSVTSRKFAACPERTSTQTWEKITDVLCKDSPSAKIEFNSVIGGVSSVICDEIPKDSPIIIRGSGPLIRIYCLYGEDAILGLETSEEEVTWNPFIEDWKVYVPCDKDEMDLMKKVIENKSDNFEIYDKSKKITFTNKDRSLSESELSIDADLLRSL